MGMYDTIHFACPSCGEAMSAQSKSGPCILDNYRHDNVPVDIAINANRHAPFKCFNCGKSWKFDNLPTMSTVALNIIEVEE